MGEPLTPTSLPKITRTFISSRSSTRQRYLSDDFLSDLTPEAAIRALTTPSGRLKESIEAATPNERAFGLRAADTSRKIHRWVEELLSWPWPKASGLTGFEMLPVESESPTPDTSTKDSLITEPDKRYDYFGGLLNSQIDLYEKRIEEIYADIENLDMDEIKRQILDTHFSPRSSPSHSFAKKHAPSFISSLPFNKIDDFTALVTATVLQALPILSKLMHLMQLWSIRLLILRKAPDLMIDMEDAEIALKSGWNAIQSLGHNENSSNYVKYQGLSRESFNIMRDILQQKVASLGKKIDFMLDTLEGTQDTLPEQWLDKMEKLEQDYGNWVVAADRKVRDDQLVNMDNTLLEDQRVEKSGPTNRNEKDQTEMITSRTEENIGKFEADSTTQDINNVGSDAEVIIGGTVIQKDESHLASSINLEDETPGTEERDRNSSVETARKEIGIQVDSFSQNSTTGTESTQAHRYIKAEKIANNVFNNPQHAESLESSDTINQKDGISLKLVAKRANKEIEKSSLESQHTNELKKMDGDRNSGESIFDTANPRSSTNSDSPNNFNLFLSSLAEAEKDKHLSAQKREFQPKTTLKSFSRNGSGQDSTKPKPKPDVSAADGCLHKAAPQGSTDTCMTNLEAESESVTNFSPDYASSDGVEDNEGSKPNPKTSDNTCLLSSESSSESSFLNDLLGQDLVCNENNTAAYSLVEPDQHTARNKSSSSSFQLITEISPKKNDSTVAENFKYLQTNSNSLDTSGSPKLPNSATVKETNTCVGLRAVKISSTESSWGDESTKLRNAEGKQLIVKNTPSSQESDCGIFVDSESLKTSYVFCNLASDHGNSSIDNELNQNTLDEIADFIPSVRLDFNSMLGKEYSLKVPLNGSTIYIENSDLISKISSKTRLNGFFKIKTLDSTQTLTQEFPGALTVNPPQKILSISCLSIAISKPRNINNYSNENSNSSLETRHQKNTTKGFLSEKHSIRLSDMQELSPSSWHDSIKGKMSPVLEESRVLPPCTNTVDIAFHNRNIEQVDAGQSPRNSSSLSINHQSDYPSSVCCRRMSTTIPPSDNEQTKDDFHSLDTFPKSQNSDTKLCHEVEINSSPIDRFDYQENSLKNSPESPVPKISKPRSVSFGPDSSSMPITLEAHIFGKVDVSSSVDSLLSDMENGSTDEKIQQRISSLLESISARICLSPDSGLNLNAKKVRQSLTRSTRSTSSLSNHGSFQAPIPSFTLAPAHGKVNSRSRRQYSPEIRIYHLSCSTGEAPIKLFVRLVGENGERVMVRVGGGWADLGEYLKEYASHHGRRVATDTVKIQDAHLCSILGGANITGPVARAHARTKLPQKPQVASDQYRQKGSLNVRKMRKSFSSVTTDNFGLKPALSTFRSPSTPLPAIKRTPCETPPSGASSNGTLVSVPSGRSSRMSWNEDDFNLGLAGPRGKSNQISDHDQEWVESMKEKVRLASVEKDRRTRERTDRVDRSERERTRGYSFGELEKVGGTKRLFRREGSLF